VGSNPTLSTKLQENNKNKKFKNRFTTQDFAYIINLLNE
jgi:hypothetical protein